MGFRPKMESVLESEATVHSHKDATVAHPATNLYCYMCRLSGRHDTYHRRVTMIRRDPRQLWERSIYHLI